METIDPQIIENNTSIDDKNSPPPEIIELTSNQPSDQQENNPPYTQSKTPLEINSPSKNNQNIPIENILKDNAQIINNASQIYKNFLNGSTQANPEALANFQRNFQLQYNQNFNQNFQGGQGLPPNFNGHVDFTNNVFFQQQLIQAQQNPLFQQNLIRAQQHYQQQLLANANQSQNTNINGQYPVHNHGGNPFPQNGIPMVPMNVQPQINMIDVSAEVLKGNLKPLLVCILQNFIDKHWIDKCGYNILHYAISNDQSFLANYLLNKIKIDVDKLSSTNQTPLMIACNFGNVEIIKLLLDKGANIDCLDSCRFSPLLYTTKQDHLQSMFYLLYKGADIHVSDSNGCTIAHWAAFKDNIFILRFLRRINFDCNSKDLKNFTPFQRAFSNYSYDSIKFLCEDNKDNLPASINLNEITSQCIKVYIKEKTDERENKFSLQRFFWKFWNSNPKSNCFKLYSLLMITIFYAFFSEILYKEKNDAYILSILFMVTGLYLIFYIYLFIYKLKNPSINKDFIQTIINKGDEVYFEENDINSLKLKKMSLDSELEMGNVNFDNLNKLLSNNQNIVYQNITIDQDSTVIFDTENGNLNYLPKKVYTFIHYICFWIDKFRFLDVMDIDFNRVCPTCLNYKYPKTKHCSVCNVCVPYYHHHSYIFDRCFNYKNHHYYFILLFLQELLLIQFLVLQISIYYNDRTSYLMLLFFENAYLIHKFDGIFMCFVFILVSILFFYNSMYFLIEIYGVLTNQTFNEIYNRHRYSYLYNTWHDKTGKMWKVYTNQTGRGIKNNLVRYVKRSLIASH